jgi:hypothetical protein
MTKGAVAQQKIQAVDEKRCPKKDGIDRFWLTVVRRRGILSIASGSDDVGRRDAMRVIGASQLLAVRGGSSVEHRGRDAPRGQGPTIENIGPHLKEEQRSPRGLIAGLMPSILSPRTARLGIVRFSADDIVDQLAFGALYFQALARS